VNTLPLWLIALLGHTSSHEPHAVQVLVSIRWGTFFLLLHKFRTHRRQAVRRAVHRSVQDTHGSMLFTMMAMSAILASCNMKRRASQFMKVGTRHLSRSGWDVSLVFR